MIRYTLLWAAVVYVVVYAWKDWVKALCILVIMLAVIERPDMPKEMMGISGMNPFNIALAGILAAWAIDCMYRPQKWDMPRHGTVLLVLYLAIVLIAFGRMMVDHTPLTNHDIPVEFRRSVRGLVVDFLINTIKFTVPGLLLFYGCRDRRQVRMAVLCLLTLLFLLAFQVWRQMPLPYLLDGQALQERALRVLDRAVGYHRVDLAMVLAGAPWAFLAARAMTRSPSANAGFVLLAGVCFVGLALTGGRMGYLSWAAAGAVLCALRWRGLLALAPVGALVVILFLPGVVDRLLQGVDVQAISSTPTSLSDALLAGDSVDTNRITSGRVELWPYVIRKIRENPLIGYGRRAHDRTGISYQVWLEMKEYFGHPHNAFLEFTLDNGVIGLAIVLCFFGVVLRKAGGLFMDPDPLSRAIGGLALASIVSFLAACLGAQSLYPTESTVPMWCMIGLTLRLWEQRKREALVTPTASAGKAPPSGAPAAPLRPRSATLWPNEIRKRRT